MKVVSNLVSSDGAKYPTSSCVCVNGAMINLSREPLTGGSGKQLHSPWM